MQREELKKIFAEQLIDRMRDNNVSQRLLSELTDIPLRTINDYVNGKTVPNAYRLYRISKALKCEFEF